jgi:hypothetical protein
VHEIKSRDIFKETLKNMENVEKDFLYTMLRNERVG